VPPTIFGYENDVGKGWMALTKSVARHKGPVLLLWALQCLWCLDWAAASVVAAFQAEPGAQRAQDGSVLGLFPDQAEWGE
jgi:hypothetical protein